MYSKSHFVGSLGDTGQPGPKQILKVSPKVTARTPSLEGLFDYICWKDALEEEVFFRRLARFCDFWYFWEALVGHFGEVFAQILIAVLERQHLRDHCFTMGWTLFWLLQLAPEASRGRKTNMRKQCQFWEVEKQLCNHFLTISRSRREPYFNLLYKLSFVSDCIFSSIWDCVWGWGRRQSWGPLA